MNLYFEHSNGGLTLVRSDCPQDNVLSEIKSYVKLLNPNYKIYYIRSWGDDIQGYTYDVGSHTEFFHWRIS